MVKNKKQDTRLTDFFIRQDPPSSQRLSSSTSKTSRPKATASNGLAAALKAQRPKVNAPPHADQEIISVSSGSHISISSDTLTFVNPKRNVKSSSFTEDVAIVSPPRRSGAKRVQPPRMGPPPRAKRSRSFDSEVQFIGASQRDGKHGSNNNNTTSKRKRTKFGDDNVDVVPLPSVIYVDRHPSKPPRPQSRLHYTPISIKSSPRQSVQGPLRPAENILRTPRGGQPAPLKKPHVEVRRQESDVELIPSSQSDEQELAVPRLDKKDLEEVKESVNKWRTGTVGSHGTTVLADDWNVAMDLEEDSGIVGNATVERTSSETEISTQLRSTFSQAATHNSSASESVSLPLFSATTTSPKCMSSHPSPDTHPCTPPPTPPPLSPRSKTAQIIAQIKANAYQATEASPEDDDEKVVFREDLDEDSSEDDGLFRGRANAAKLDEPLPDARHCHSPSPMLSRASISTSISPFNTFRRSRVAAAPGNRPKAVAKINTPIASKVKPKKRSSLHPLDMLLKEKKMAEKKGASLQLAETVLNSRAGENDWTNEQAALDAVRLAPGDDQYDDLIGDEDESMEGTGEAILDEEARAKLLGSKRGKIIGDILIKDKEGMEETTWLDKAAGVELWNRGVVEDFVREWEMSLEVTSGCSVLEMLKDALDRNDIAQAKLLLNPNIFCSLPCSPLIKTAPWLFSQALSPKETPLSLSCLRVLSHLSHVKGGVTASLVISALVRLGSTSAVFHPLDAGVMNAFVSEKRRAEIIQRLTMVLTPLSRARSILNHDVPDIVLSLMLVAMDPTTSAVLRRELMIAIDAGCQSLGHGEEIVAEIEATISTKLLTFAVQLAPINKSLFISFLSGGSGRTKRIARCVAHGLLLGLKTAPAHQYTATPSLTPLLSLLSPIQGSDSPFRVQSNSATIDYEDLEYHVNVLSVALSDIDAYVAAERFTNRSKETGLSGIDEKPLTNLEMVKHLLEVVNGRIDDTRAAHLDRSRTKAAIQNLTHRIYYQRCSALKAFRRGRQPIIDEWLHK